MAEGEVTREVDIRTTRGAPVGVLLIGAARTRRTLAVPSPAPPSPPAKPPDTSPPQPRPQAQTHSAGPEPPPNGSPIRLTVHILGARGLAAPGGRPPDPCAVLRAGTIVLATGTCEGTCDPVWDEALSVAVPAHGALTLGVFTGGQLLGETTITAADLQGYTSATPPLRLPLALNGRSAGEVTVSVHPDAVRSVRARTPKGSGVASPGHVAPLLDLTQPVPTHTHPSPPAAKQPPGRAAPAVEPDAGVSEALTFSIVVLRALDVRSNRISAAVTLAAEEGGPLHRTTAQPIKDGTVVWDEGAFAVHVRPTGTLTCTLLGADRYSEAGVGVAVVYGSTLQRSGAHEFWVAAKDANGDVSGQLVLSVSKGIPGTRPPASGPSPAPDSAPLSASTSSSEPRRVPVGRAVLPLEDNGDLAHGSALPRGLTQTQTQAQTQAQAPAPTQAHASAQRCAPSPSDTTLQHLEIALSQAVGVKATRSNLSATLQTAKQSYSTRLRLLQDGHVVWDETFVVPLCRKDELIFQVNRHHTPVLIPKPR